MVRSLVMFFCLIAPFSLSAQISIAVLGFKSDSGFVVSNIKPEEVSRTGVSAALAALGKFKGVKPVDRTKLLEQAAEIQLDLTGLTGLATQKATLEISDADLLFIASVERPFFSIHTNRNPDHMSESPVEYQGKLQYQLNMEIISKIDAEVIWSYSQTCAAADYVDAPSKLDPNVLMHRSLKTKIEEGLSGIDRSVFLVVRTSEPDETKGSIVLLAGKDQGVRKGMRFRLFRLDSDGSSKPVATVVIRKVEGNRSLAKIMNGSRVSRDEKYVAKTVR